MYLHLLQHNFSFVQFWNHEHTGNAFAFLEFEVKVVGFEKARGWYKFYVWFYNFFHHIKQQYFLPSYTLNPSQFCRDKTIITYGELLSTRIGNISFRCVYGFQVRCIMVLYLLDVFPGIRQYITFWRFHVVGGCLQGMEWQVVVILSGILTIYKFQSLSHHSWVSLLKSRQAQIHAKKTL